MTKVKVLHIKYSFRGLYGIGEDEEWIEGYQARSKGLLLYEF
jgi:hypothetical protein